MNILDKINTILIIIKTFGSNRISSFKIKQIIANIYREENDGFCHPTEYTEPHGDESWR